MNSIWNENIKRPRFERLTHDIKTDVLIIGGGITGILCAYMLKQAGIDCVLVEAKQICSGITQNTTAKITVQHGLIYDEMMRRFGSDVAWLYLQAQDEALQKYRALCSEIPCDYKLETSFVYSLFDEEKIEREVRALNCLGYDAVFSSKLPIPVSVAGAVRIDDQAQFHPLKFAFSIAKDLPIYENTKVLELTKEGAVTNHGKIKAQKIIVTTHFPFINKHGLFFVKLYQHRSYVIALENAPEIDGMYVDEDKKGLSFRKYNGLLLLGGGGHRTGKQGGGWRELKSFAKTNYPKSKEVCRWATQDCMSLDNIPYIGQYSKRTPNLYVATGFNKWGMTSAMVAAMLLCDQLQEKDSEYSEIFSPSRSILRPQLAVNAAESIMGLLKPTTPRCPHLGCALKYNKEEHSWDCSCHGSRFTKNGELIDNPATDDKKQMLKKQE